MGNVIFEGASASLIRITPIVFGNKLFQTSLSGNFRSAHRLCSQLAPLILLDLPLILKRLFRPIGANVVFHRQAYIVLTIYTAGHRRDCLLGYNFGDEHDAPSVFIALFATYVKAEVYLIEIRMKRDRKGPKEFGAAKPKAHEANVCSSSERIQHCAARDILV